MVYGEININIKLESDTNEGKSPRTEEEETKREGLVIFKLPYGSSGP